jgi:uncharacterized membrane protein
MPDNGETPAAHPTESGWRSGMHRLRNYLLTGLVIAAPLFLTIYITWSFIQWVDSWVRPFIPDRYSPETYLPFSIPGFGLIVAVVFLILLGFLAANLVGRTLVGYSEMLLGRMPFIRGLYRGIKQIFETAFSQKARAFQTVGLVEYPRKGVWSIVFIAADTSGEVAARLGPEEFVTVFLPPTPVPTAGFMLFVRRSEVVVLDMSVEDAAKFIISAGLVTPEYQARTAELAEAARLKVGS